MRREDRREWLAATGAGSSARLVALVLTLYENRNGWAWPAVRSVAELADLDERTVRRALRELVDLGEYERDRRPGRTDGYRFIHNNPGQDARGHDDRGHGVPDRGHLRREPRAPRPTKVVRRDIEERTRARRPAVDEGAAAPPKKAAAPPPNNPSPVFTDERGTFLPGTGWVQ